MGTPQAPLPRRRPARTREELLAAGRERGGDVRPSPEPAERLGALLMLAFPVEPRSVERPDPENRSQGEATDNQR